MRPLRAVIAVVVALVLLGPAGGSGGAQAALPGAAAAARPSHVVTLITGDVVRVGDAGDGRPAIAVRSAGGGYQVTTKGRDTYVVPAEALPHVLAGRLDEELFNVTQLIAAGYDDASRATLPLLLMPPAGGSSAVPANPPGAARRAVLPSIRAAAVAADKAQARRFWEGLTPRLAGPRSTFARPGDVGKVWLDRKVRVALADSVPQVGAPQAWAAGFTGAGVTVAVLDSGYDPGHPDLVGKVRAAQDFTGEGSPVDAHGHGTHVAATIAGGPARTGVAPGARLIVGRVLDASGSGDLSWVVAGMEWAVAQGARVVNVSLGAGPSDGTDPVSVAVDSLTAKTGALFVVAAGNAGPEAGSVQAPGTAAAALTVGAVSKGGQLASFSGRGPRLGDGMVKPELTAPGVGIVAARAGGTSSGELVDDLTTSMSGTSMATPHVAGAAALLAQQHPDWRADRLKAALVGTARPVDGPAIAAGTGQVDVAAAVRRAVRVQTSSVAFGRIPWTGGDRDDVSTKVTYRNDSPSAVTLDLTAAARADASPAAALSVSPARLTVPAGAQASAVLRLDPDHTPGGVYTGQVVATGPEGALRVPVGFAVEGETFALTVHATARDGRAPGAYSQAQLWNLDTGELHREIVGADPAVLRVAPGRYALMVYAFTVDSGDWPRELTVLGDPELTVRGDRTVRLDARTASEIRVRTPEDAQVRDAILAWQRVVGEKSIVTGFGLNPQMTTRFFAAPTTPVTVGSFEFTSHFELGEPPLTATAPGLVLTPAPVDNTPAFDGRRRLPVVDGDRSLAGARGAAVLLRAPSGEPVDTQLAAAQAAGAALVLLHSGDDVYFEAWSEGAGVPAVSLQQDAAQALLRRLAEHRPVTLDVTATPQSPYSYQMVLPERGRIPASLTYDTRRLPMATVETEVHDLGTGAPAEIGRYAITPTALAAYSSFQVVPTPARRTDHLTVGRPGAEVTWRPEASADLSGWFPNGTMSGLPHVYRAGDRARDTWFPALTRPAVPATAPAYAYGAPANRSADALRIAIPHYATGSATQYGWLGGGDSAQLTLHRNGVLVGSSGAPAAQFTVPPDAAAYRLRLEVTRDQPWWTTSTATSSTWTFRSSRPTSGIAVLPLLQLDYALDTDLRNTVRADRAYTLVIRPGYQPGASGRGPVVTRAEVSYDGGATWQALTRRAGDVFRVPPAPDDGFATLRVTARDRAGNTLDQTIVRAWRVAVD